MEILCFMDSYTPRRLSLKHLSFARNGVFDFASRFSRPENFARFTETAGQGIFMAAKTALGFFSASKNILVPAAVLSVFGWLCGLAIFALCDAGMRFFSVPAVHSFAREIEILDEAMLKFVLPNGERDESVLLISGGSLANTAPLGAMPYTQPVTFTQYTVKSGETISGIARQFNLTNISTLISVNDIQNVRLLRAGQKLSVPSLDGIFYQVKQGDTLAGISVKHNITVEDILDVNNLDSTAIIAGSKLFLPGIHLDSTALKKAMGELFVSPLAGSWRFSSPFGWRPDPFTGVRSQHTGIDMAVPLGTPILTAMSGTVVAASYSSIYGNYVIINHGNGYQTLYGHMQKILAQKGQVVNQGSKIGLVGSTGYSTGPHLHFSVYKNGRLIDPMSVLKK
jgi:murein DD-endopeptidase MepM/ murein hydrolase activator NlpD